MINHGRYHLTPPLRIHSLLYNYIQNDSAFFVVHFQFLLTLCVRDCEPTSIGHLPLKRGSERHHAPGRRSSRCSVVFWGSSDAAQCIGAVNFFGLAGTAGALVSPGINVKELSIHKRNTAIMMYLLYIWVV